MKRFLFLIGVVAMLAMNATANIRFTMGKLRFWVCDDGKSVYLQGVVDGQTVTGDLYIPQTVTDGDKEYTVVGLSSNSFYKQILWLHQFDQCHHSEQSGISRRQSV